MTNKRLHEQMTFLAEIDQLKKVLRRSTLQDQSRHENSAEHSWHISVMATVLAEHANERVDILHVIKMLLVHDLVEIDAGDTFCYDEVGHLDKEEKERQAADRIFGLLPADQGKALRVLWDEFEARETPEARFANALDRLQPVLQNYRVGGGTWVEYGISLEQVIKRNRPIADGSEALWEYARAMIDEIMTTGDKSN